MVVIIKKPVAKLAVPLAPEIVEPVYGPTEMKADLDTILDAQAAIAGRKLPSEIEEAIKVMNQANAYDQQRIKEATARLMQHVVPADHPKDQPLTKLIGNRSVEISKCTKKREVVDKEKAAKMMGMDVFWKIASIPLKAIDDYLTLPQREQVLKTSWEDDRKLTVKAPIETEL